MLGFSPSAFYSSELREVKLAIEGYNLKKKQNHRLSQIAMTNALGIFFGGKGFKQIDPFEKKKPEKLTVESKSTTFDYLHNRFKIKEGEDN